MKHQLDKYGNQIASLQKENQIYANEIAQLKAMLEKASTKSVVNLSQPSVASGHSNGEENGEDERKYIEK